MTPSSPANGETPLDQLSILAMQSVSIDADLEHLEIYTSEGLLTLLWHGAADLENAVVFVGGAMGGLLGPGGGLFHQLGRVLPSHGIGVMRVSYRRANDLARCVHDTVAAMDLMARHGARRFVTAGHSFGGAVAIQAAANFDRDSVPGVVTFATQSAGCEPAETLADRDLLLFHGTADRILPPQSSEMVRFLAETGELVLLPGADHLLESVGPQIFERLLTHLPGVFAAAADGSSDRAPGY